MIKVCALMAIYNEEDILKESLESLIINGVDVYIIDNDSKDNSLKIAQDFFGKGVVGIEIVKHSEFGKDVYNWTKILQRKQELSKNLDYDWFIHVDADEIRCPPWQQMTLREGVEFVDFLGYNLINFKLFNFRLTKEASSQNTSMNGMNLYSPAERFNSRQVKAWKKNTKIDIVTHGGHLALIENPNICPYRFILKHYPLRSKIQAINKINRDRKDRFSTEDKAKGWHVQYNSLPIDESSLAEKIYHESHKLLEFNINNESSSINIEGLIATRYYDLFGEFLGKEKTGIFWKNFILRFHGLSLNEVDAIIQFHNEMMSAIRQSGFSINAYMQIPNELRELMLAMLVYDAIDCYAKGNPFLFDSIPYKIMAENFKSKAYIV
jgi:glycosyltransferase involved in cell wall biosynthesis